MSYSERIYKWHEVNRIAHSAWMFGLITGLIAGTIIGAHL